MRPVGRWRVRPLSERVWFSPCRFSLGRGALSHEPAHWVAEGATNPHSQHPEQSNSLRTAVVGRQLPLESNNNGGPLLPVDSCLLAECLTHYAPVPGAAEGYTVEEAEDSPDRSSRERLSAANCPAIRGLGRLVTHPGLFDLQQTGTVRVGTDTEACAADSRVTRRERAHAHNSPASRARQ